MRNENIELVQSLYAAFQRGDIPTIVAATAPDVLWESVGRRKDHPALGQRHGRAGVEEFFRAVADSQDVVSFTPRAAYADGDMVFMLGHYAWTMRKTGKPVDSDWLHVITVRNGQVTAFREFTDTAQFAEAYGG